MNIFFRVPRYCLCAPNRQLAHRFIVQSSLSVTCRQSLVSSTSCRRISSYGVKPLHGVASHRMKTMVSQTPSSSRSQIGKDSCGRDHSPQLESVVLDTSDTITPSSSFELEESMIWMAGVAKSLFKENESLTEISDPHLTSSEVCEAHHFEQKTKGPPDRQSTVPLPCSLRKSLEAEKNSEHLCDVPQSSSASRTEMPFIVDPQLKNSRWQTVMHSRFQNAHPLYTTKIMELYEALKNALGSLSSPSEKACFIHRATAELHSDALLLLMEYIVAEESAFPLHSSSSRTSTAATTSFHAQDTLPRMGTLDEASGESGNVLMLLALLRHVWGRTLEYSSKHIVQLLPVLYSLFPLLPKFSNPSVALSIHATALWSCYVQRHALRRIQNSKCLSALVQGSLLCNRTLKFKRTTVFPRESVENDSDNTTQWMKLVTQLEEKVFSHLLMRYITSKDSDVASDTVRDITYPVQFCVTHRWGSLIPAVRLAAVAWLQKQKQKQQHDHGNAPSFAGRLPGFLERAADLSRGPKELFQNMTRLVQDTNGFSDVELERVYLIFLLNSSHSSFWSRRKETGGGKEAFNESHFFSSFLHQWNYLEMEVLKDGLESAWETEGDGIALNSNSSPTVNDFMASEMEQMSSSDGVDYLGHIETLHRFFPVCSPPSSLGPLVVSYPVLCSVLVTHILCREWPRLVQERHVESDGWLPSERRMLSSLWLLLRFVNILDVIHTVFHMLPLLRSGWEGSTESTLWVKPKRDMGAKSSEGASTLSGFPEPYPGVRGGAGGPPCAVVTAVMRCVGAFTPASLVRVALQQLLEERELAALPLHPLAIEFVARLWQRSQAPSSFSSGGFEAAPLWDDVAKLFAEQRRLSDSMRDPDKMVPHSGRWWDAPASRVPWPQPRALVGNGKAGEIPRTEPKELPHKKDDETSILESIYCVMTHLEEELKLFTLMASMQKKIFRFGKRKKELVQLTEICGE